MRFNNRSLLESLEERRLLSVSLFVTPFSTPADTTHYHSLAAAYNAAPADSTITVLAGAVTETSVITLAKAGLTIQGDPNVSPLSLPRYNLTLNANSIVINHLAVQNLIISIGFGKAIVRNSDLISISILSNNTIGGGFNTFDGNTVRGTVVVTGDAIAATNDTFTHNTFISNASTIVSETNDFGFTFTDNTILGDPAAPAYGLYLAGDAANLNISRNKISMGATNSIALYIHGAYQYGVIENNVFSTADQGIGIQDTELLASGTALTVQGNNFTNNLIGVNFIGDIDAYIGFDLGGGARGSLGGNDFRTFTGIASNDAIKLSGVTPTNVSTTDILFAKNNAFPTGATLTSLVLAATGYITPTALTPTQAFIANLYNTLLERSPNASDYTYWSSVYTAKGQAAVVTGIQKSTEALDIVVNNAYLQYLNRDADSAGEAYWVSQIQAGGGGMAETTLDAGLLSSTEFIAGHNADYIQDLYETILNRTAASTDITYWYTQLPTLGLKGIATALLNSTESRTDIITSLVQTYLHRNPTSTDLTYLLGTNADPLRLQSIILGTTEYFTRG